MFGTTNGSHFDWVAIPKTVSKEVAASTVGTKDQLSSDECSSSGRSEPALSEPNIHAFTPVSTIWDVQHACLVLPMEVKFRIIRAYHTKEIEDAILEEWFSSETLRVPQQESSTVTYSDACGVTQSLYVGIYDSGTGESCTLSSITGYLQGQVEGILSDGCSNNLHIIMAFLHRAYYTSNEIGSYSGPKIMG